MTTPPQPDIPLPPEFQQAAPHADATHVLRQWRYAFRIFFVVLVLGLLGAIPLVFWSGLVS